MKRKAVLLVMVVVGMGIGFLMGQQWLGLRGADIGLAAGLQESRNEELQARLESLDEINEELTQAARDVLSGEIEIDALTDFLDLVVLNVENQLPEKLRGLMSGWLELVEACQRARDATWFLSDLSEGELAELTAREILAMKRAKDRIEVGLRIYYGEAPAGISTEESSLPGFEGVGGEPPEEASGFAQSSCEGDLECVLEQLQKIDEFLLGMGESGPGNSDDINACGEWVEDFVRSTASAKADAMDCLPDILCMSFRALHGYLSELDSHFDSLAQSWIDWTYASGSEEERAEARAQYMSELLDTIAWKEAFERRVKGCLGARPSDVGATGPVPEPANRSPDAVALSCPVELNSGDLGEFAVAAEDPDEDTLSYWWDFGDGTAEEGPRIKSHRFQKPGTYEICVTVRDGRGGEDRICCSVTVLGREPRPSEPSGPSGGVDAG